MAARPKTSRESGLSHHVSHLTNSQNLPTVTSEYFLTVFRVFTLILLMCVQIRVLLCVCSWLWHMKSRNDTGYPRPLAGPPGLSPRPPHEVDKRHRLSKASPPPPHTKSTKDTGYKAWHSPTSCVFSGRRARPDERETETDWRPRARTQKRYGPVRMHRPVAI